MSKNNEPQPNHYLEDDDYGYLEDGFNLLPPTPMSEEIDEEERGAFDVQGWPVWRNIGGDKPEREEEGPVQNKKEKRKGGEENEDSTKKSPVEAPPKLTTTKEMTNLWDRLSVLQKRQALLEEQIKEGRRERRVRHRIKNTTLVISPSNELEKVKAKIAEIVMQITALSQKETEKREAAEQETKRLRNIPEDIQEEAEIRNLKLEPTIEIQVNSHNESADIDPPTRGARKVIQTKLFPGDSVIKTPEGRDRGSGPRLTYLGLKGSSYVFRNGNRTTSFLLKQLEIASRSVSFWNLETPKIEEDPQQEQRDVAEDVQKVLDISEGGAESGETSEGDAESGETSEGGAESGETSEGDAESRETSERGAESGETSEGGAESGETSEGGAESGETSEGDAESGETSEGGVDDILAEDKGFNRMLEEVTGSFIFHNFDKPIADAKQKLAAEKAKRWFRGFFNRNCRRLKRVIKELETRKENFKKALKKKTNIALLNGIYKDNRFSDVKKPENMAELLKDTNLFHK
jgi:hypothetical protein